MAMTATFGNAPATAVHPNVGLPEPVFNAGTQTMVYQDDMSSYTTLTAMGAAGQVQPLIAPQASPLIGGGAVNPAKNAIITPGVNGAAQAIRIFYDGTGDGVRDPSFWVWNQPTVAASATNYFQYYFRATFASSLGSAVAVKWFEIWPTPQSVDRTQFNTHDFSPGGPSANSKTCWQVYSQSQATAGQGDQPLSPYPNDNSSGQSGGVFDGNWHRITYAVRSQSVAHAHDGFAQMWVDGIMVVNISLAAVGVVPAGGDRAWCGIDDVDAILVSTATTGSTYDQTFGGVQTTVTPAWMLDLGAYKHWSSP